MELTLGTTRLSGELRIPPSKSVAHRALICAALSAGEHRIAHLERNDDVIATARALETLGARVEWTDDGATVIGIERCRPIEDAVIDCNESGSTLRFIVPIVLAMGARNVRLIGRGKLGSRPMRAYRDLCAAQGIGYRDASADHADRRLDLTLDGKLRADTFRMPGDVSSQFLTGLLFAMPLLDGCSRLEWTTPLESTGYLDLTLQAMREAGIRIDCDASGYACAPQTYRMGACEIEGDYSQAAFFAVANALGGDVRVQGLRADSLQGDRAIYPMLERLARSDGQTLRLDGADCPDIIPVLCVACALRNGTTVLERVGRLRLKECDRQQAIVRELSALGADIRAQGDTIEIRGVPRLRGGVETDSHADHRIAMSLAIAACACKSPIRLRGAECVSKSYPNFFEDYRRLGGTAK